MACFLVFRQFCMELNGLAVKLQASVSGSICFYKNSFQHVICSVVGETKCVRQVARPADPIHLMPPLPPKDTVHTHTHTCVCTRACTHTLATLTVTQTTGYTDTPHWPCSTLAGSAGRKTHRRHAQCPQRHTHTHTHWHAHARTHARSHSLTPPTPPSVV